MAPALRPDQTRRVRHREAIERLKRQEESRTGGAIRGIATRGVDNRRRAVADVVDDSPSLPADADDVAMAQLRGPCGHPGAGCTARSRGRAPGIRCLWLYVCRICQPSRAGEASILTKARDGRAEMRLGGVPELLHQRMALERLLDEAPLDAFAASMNEADLPEARLVRRADVLFDYGFDVAGREGVEIERLFDGDAVRHGAV